MSETTTPQPPAADGKSKRRYMPPDVVKHDTLRRHIKRALPVPLTRDEQTDIAIGAAKKRRQVKQLEADLDAEKKRRQAQINDLQREIDTADRELDTGEQERTIMCDEIFKDGQVFTVRTDTWEAFEQRAATAQEAQRFLPAVEATIDQAPRRAAASPGSAPAGTGAGKDRPGELADPQAALDDADPDHDLRDDADEPEDDGLTDLTPAQRAAKESAAARRARRADKNGGAK